MIPKQLTYTKNTFSPLSLCIALIIVFMPAFSLYSQSTTPGEKVNRFAVGLRFSHLYDMKFTSYDRLDMNTVGNDVWGLNGPNTRFDMAGGLDLAYFFSPLFSLDAGVDFGRMTGANDLEYYRSSVQFYNVGANFNLKRNTGVKSYKWVPFARVSAGMVNFDAERFFIEDDGEIGRVSDMAFQMGIGLGLRYHISRNLHAHLSSEFRTVFNDGFDGHDYGSGRDHMLQTMIGIRYSFGKGKNVDQTPAWQDRRIDETIAKMQTLDDTVQALNQGLISLNDLTKEELEKVAKRQEKINEELEALKKQKQKRELTTNNVQAYSVFFGFNQWELTPEHKKQLLPLVSILKSEEAYKAYIAAYTDNVGSAEANQRVRDRRKEAVINFLEQNGISKDRIQILDWNNDDGYSSDPFLDRRTEVIIK